MAVGGYEDPLMSSRYRIYVFPGPSRSYANGMAPFSNVVSVVFIITRTTMAFPAPSFLPNLISGDLWKLIKRFNCTTDRLLPIVCSPGVVFPCFVCNYYNFAPFVVINRISVRFSDD